MKNRRPNRLKHYDYSENGYYFVTICTYNRECFFGEIVEEEMVLNRCGEIVNEQWLWLDEQYPYVRLDEYCIMPNHFHGILIIDRSTVGNGRDRSLQKIKPLYELIGVFKTRSSKFIHRKGLKDFKWQKSFYDHIIRNEVSLRKIRNYIQTNPVTWDNDKENLNFIPVTRRV